MKKITLTEQQLKKLFAIWGASERKTPKLNTANWEFFILFEDGKIYQANKNTIDCNPITEISAIDLVEEMKEFKFEWEEK